MITVNNISKSYGETQALKSVSLDVQQGELFGLIGPDGAGKTTLMRILMSLLLPSGGTAHMNSFDVVNDYKEIRLCTGYMPGKFSLYQDLSVQENMEFFATVFGTTIEENYHLVKDIYSQIEPFKDRRAGKLSGGMKQKLALSCAMIHKPEILILDEPTTGVDAVSRKEFWGMLKGLKNQGITIMVSTPYMDEATLCDRIALIQNGEIFGVDTPHNLMEQYPEDLWSAHSDNSLYQTALALENLPEIISANSFGQNLHVATHKGKCIQPDIENFLKEKGHHNICIEKIPASIEDVFMLYMQKKKH